MLRNDKEHDFSEKEPPLPLLIEGERRGGACLLSCDDIGAGVPETLPRVKFADYCPKIAVANANSLGDRFPVPGLNAIAVTRASLRRRACN